MAREIIVTPRAQKDIHGAYQWGLHQSQWTCAQVEDWHFGLWRAIYFQSFGPKPPALAGKIGL